MGRIREHTEHRFVYRSDALVELFNRLQDWRAIAFIGVVYIVPMVLLAVYFGDMDERVEGWFMAYGVVVLVVLLIECRRQVTIDRGAGTVDERVGLPISWERWHYGLDEFDAVVVRRRYRQELEPSDRDYLPQRVRPRCQASWKRVYEVIIEGPDSDDVRIDVGSDYDSMLTLAETVAQFAQLVLLDRTEHANRVE